MKKIIVTIIALLIVLGCILYIYVSNSIVIPFAIESSKAFVVNDASKYINTTHEYEFRFVNTSDKKLNLIRIDLQVSAARFVVGCVANRIDGATAIQSPSLRLATSILSH